MRAFLDMAVRDKFEELAKASTNSAMETGLLNTHTSENELFRNSANSVLQEDQKMIVKIMFWKNVPHLIRLFSTVTQIYAWITILKHTKHQIY